MKHEDKFTTKDLEEAVADLSLMKFFPSEPGSREAVMTLLRKMCPHRTALRWLVSEMVNHVREWPGAAEMRGLLCTRYDAADGIDQYCGIQGYRPCDYEERHYEQHKQLMSGSWQNESSEVLKRIAKSMKPKGLLN